jgi:hypothetical protein
MSYRLWYRTFTEYTDIIPDLQAFATYAEALEHADAYMTDHDERNDKYVREVEIQHVQCGEMIHYCECEANL